MVETVRLRATIVVEYDADPKDYETSDPVEMARIDQRDWDDRMLTYDILVSEDDAIVTFEPVIKP